ncbi:hypothetical protein GMMP15_550011 [Candidatus Magnetomoraceae bacterium gMMP-15]
MNNNELLIEKNNYEKEALKLKQEEEGQVFVVIELKNQLRMAKAQIELQKDLLQYKDNEIKDLKKVQYELLKTIGIAIRSQEGVHSSLQECKIFKKTKFSVSNVLDKVWKDKFHEETSF